MSNTSKSYYVRRANDDGRVGYVGSLRPLSRAEREADAWRQCGWTADVLANTAEVRAEVRAWQREVRARGGHAA